MRDGVRMNAMRSGLVVVASLAFGYLSFQVGFKPFLQNAQSQSLSQPQPLAPADDDRPDSPLPELQQKQQGDSWIRE
ncbi:hypothetical protein MLD38_039647 [Melastoma candidum]|nr:hypothetical protein MLD38_039647 [Melastoma candidum]